MSHDALPQSHAPAGAVHVCPMHPEVRQTGPGRCPKCGMHLVPEAEASGAAAGPACHGHEHHGHGASAHHARGHDTAARSEPGKTYDHVPPGWTGAVYTCPMHPEVRQTEAGSCPICGMGLELESAAMVDDGPNPELVDFTRRFWVGAALTVPLLVLTMGPLVGLGGVRDIFGERATLWVEMILEHTADGDREHEDRLATEEPLEIRLAAPGQPAERVAGMGERGAG